MQRTLITMIMTVTVCAGCRATGQASQLRQASAQPMTAVSVQASSAVPAIDHRPFQFWMHRNTTDHAPILASNRTTKDLRYVSRNEGINQDITPAALNCMGEIFEAIAREDLEQSAEWATFRAKFPHRFLQVLPEVHDFYSFGTTQPSADEISAPDVAHLTGPVLWAGQNGTESGFRLRGYLKWRGILLGDGSTCLISRGDDVRSLLSHAIGCEDGDADACTHVMD